MPGTLKHDHVASDGEALSLRDREPCACGTVYDTNSVRCEVGLLSLGAFDRSTTRNPIRTSEASCLNAAAETMRRFVKTDVERAGPSLDHAPELRFSGAERRGIDSA